MRIVSEQWDWGKRLTISGQKRISKDRGWTASYLACRDLALIPRFRDIYRKVAFEPTSPFTFNEGLVLRISLNIHFSNLTCVQNTSLTPNEYAIIRRAFCATGPQCAGQDRRRKRVTLNRWPEDDGDCIRIEGLGKEAYDQRTEKGLGWSGLGSIPPPLPRQALDSSPTGHLSKSCV